MDQHLLETIDKCLKFADPGLPPHARLLTLKGKIEHNVMLGPQARRFLQKCLEVQDNIECEQLTHDGKCKIPRVGECEYRPQEGRPLAKFKKCPYYEAKRAQIRGNPLSKL